jgi:hypothetical protein
MSDTESGSDSEYELDEITTQITTTGISALYYGYLKDNKLLLSPQYQRDLCWSVDKMILFIDTIMKSWIVPNYVIYKLTKTEINNNDHSYECIDGQHRLTAIKRFIEAIPDDTTKKYVYYKKDEYRVFYDYTDQQEKEIRKQTPSKYKIRKFDRNEKNKFDDYQMSLHIISNPTGLDITTKCCIFNRLQNGEKIASYEKLKNNPHPITKCINDHKLLRFMKNENFNDILEIKKMRKYEAFNIYFLIRTFLIIDKKNLDVNYLDLNIKQYIEAQGGNGTKSVKLNNNIDELFPKVKDIIKFIIKKCDKKIIPELAYIYICIYINYGEDKLNSVIDSLKNNLKDYNNPKKYKSLNGTVSSAELITKEYKNIEKEYINKK